MSNFGNFYLPLTSRSVVLRKTQDQHSEKLLVNGPYSIDIGNQIPTNGGARGSNLDC